MSDFPQNFFENLDKLADFLKEVINKLDYRNLVFKILEILVV